MIIDYKDLKEIREKFADKRIVLIKGTFDLFHIGHLYTLQTAKSHGDILVAIVKCDDVVKLKGIDRPIISETSRAKIVDAIKYVDYTIIANKKFDVDNTLTYDSEKDIMQYQYYYNIISNLKPDILIYPEGYSLPNSLLRVYNAIGTKVIRLEREPQLGSSTDIIESIDRTSSLRSSKI